MGNDGADDEKTNGESDYPSDSPTQPGDPGAGDDEEGLAASLEDIPKAFPQPSAHPTSEADAPAPPG